MQLPFGTWIWFSYSVQFFPTLLNGLLLFPLAIQGNKTHQHLAIFLGHQNWELRGNHLLTSSVKAWFSQCMFSHSDGSHNHSLKLLIWYFIARQAWNTERVWNHKWIILYGDNITSSAPYLFHIQWLISLIKAPHWEPHPCAPVTLESLSVRFLEYTANVRSTN